MADPYASGAYFEDTGRHSEDAAFKIQELLRIFDPLAEQHRWKIQSYADVGCGSGDVVSGLSQALRQRGQPLDQVQGYDVSPHVASLTREGVQLIHGDFSQTETQVDLVTLFDVFEHVAEPIEFLKRISQRTKLLALRIPLDHTLNNSLRDWFKKGMSNPGHILFMDPVFALNILTLSGLRVLDYSYSFGFNAPSGHSTRLSRAARPARAALAKLSPYLLSKTLGGASLVVVAAPSTGGFDGNQSAEVETRSA